MKYKVGDKFVIEIEEIYNGDLAKHEEHMHLHRIKGFNSLVLDEYGLDKLQKYDKHAENLERNHEVLKIFEEKYNQGLQDAWELARRLFGYSCDTKLYAEDLKEIFGSACEMDILRNNTAQQALAKIEAYEESKVIKVGDVVRFKNSKTELLITSVARELNGIHIQTDECGKVGEVNSGICRKDVEKTGKHLDIEHLLEQIRGDS